MNFKKYLVFAMSLTSMMAAKSFADDIDIYTGKTGKAESNILFMIDVSGSMAYDNPTRISQVKTGLIDTLNKLPNHLKVGVGIYNGSGGSIISPIERLGNVATGKYSSSVENGNDDAFENENGIITNNSKTLPFSGTNSTRIEVMVNNEDDDATQCTDGGYFYFRDRYSLNLNNGDCGWWTANSVGTIFRNLNIPKKAKIINAYVEYTYGFNSNYQESDAIILIEDSTRPARYANRNNRRINDRDYYNFGQYENIGRVTWSPAFGGYYDQKMQTPNIAPLIQSIVNANNWSQDNNGVNIVASGLPYQRRGNIGVYAYDQTPSKAAKLVVEYLNDVTVNNAPYAYQPAEVNSEIKNKIGISYSNVYIPSYVDLESGYLELTSSKDVLNGGSINISLVDYGDSKKINAGNDFDISSKNILYTKTVSFYNWQKDQKYKIDIKDILFDYFNNDNWCAGQDLMFILTSDDLTSFYAYEEDKSKSAKLFIEYNGTQDNSCGIKSTLTTLDSPYDDGFVYNSGNEYINESYIRIGTDSKTGVRFQNINLNSGDEVVEAYIEFIASENSSSAMTINISGDVSNNNNPQNYYSSTSTPLISRNQLTSSLSMNIPSFNRFGTVRTENISSLIQELINKGNWVSGNSMSFIMNSGYGVGYFYSFEYDKAYAPKLYLKVKKKGSESGITVRNKLIDTIDNLKVKGGTPILGSTLEAYNYFTGNEVLGGVKRDDEFKYISSPKSWINGEWIIPSSCDVDNDYDSYACRSEKISGSPTYISPMTENSCETNNLIMITDGYPTEQMTESFPNGDSVSGKVKEITGNQCNSTWDCIYSITKYMAENDLNKNLVGVQNIYTNVVGFGNFDSEDELKQYAQYGLGNFYKVTETSALTSALEIIVDSILDIETTIATPGVSVNQNNKFQYLNELYYSVFKPSKLQSWEGNLKKYKIKAVNTNGTKFEIIDKNGNNAINEETGFFKESSRSFWSNLDDGKDVTIGGAASKILRNRNIFTFTDDENSMTNVTMNADKYKLNENNPTLNKASFGISESWTQTDYSNFIKWINGYDMNDENNNGITDEARKQMSDPLHSQPTVVNYSNNASTIFVSTNEGMLHGIDTETGNELFSFIPKSLLKNQYKRYRNKVGSHIYGLDSTWIAYRHDSDKNGVIGNSDNDFVYLYGGMRRGGKEYYSIDVTNIHNGNTKTARYPRMNFVISPEKGIEFAKMGQTWSIPVLARIRYSGSERIVMIFGGGYDQGNDNESLITSNSYGNQIYMVDAKTGELLWWASNDNTANLTLPDMKFSIAGKISLLDLDNDGFTDYMYASDMGGQIFKIRINQGNTSKDNFATGKTFAKLGITDTERAIDLSNNRKFYERPTLAPVSSPSGEKYLAIVATSGYRANPLNTGIHDGMFVLKDKDIINDELGTETIKISDLYDITYDIDELNLIDKISSKNGYYLWMKEGAESSSVFKGEKGMGEVTVFNNTIYFTTYFPEAEPKSCSPVAGVSRSYSVNLFNGMPNSNRDNESTDSTPNEKRYEELPLGGLASGTKIIYTNEGVAALTNTDTEGLGLVSGLGLFKANWYPKVEKTKNDDINLIPPHLR